MRLFSVYLIERGRRTIAELELRALNAIAASAEALSQLPALAPGIEPARVRVDVRERERAREREER